MLTEVSGGDYDLEWSDAGSGDMTKAVYDPREIEADAFDRANHAGDTAAPRPSPMPGQWRRKMRRITRRTADLGDAALLDIGGAVL